LINITNQAHSPPQNDTSTTPNKTAPKAEANQSTNQKPFALEAIRATWYRKPAYGHQISKAGARARPTTTTTTVRYYINTQGQQGMPESIKANIMQSA
jgi:hypothetical protein